MKGRFALVVRSISETKRVRYLLGLSSSAEREVIESEYFANEDAFQEMLSAEDDLIDAYARGELSDEERRGFEKTFANSLRGRGRIQFARAFAGTISAIQPLETELPSARIAVVKLFKSPGLLRAATVVIIVVAVLAWLINDRRKLSNEARELRAESEEFRKRTEELRRSSDAERSRNAEIVAQLAELRAQADKPRQRERTRTSPQPEIKNGRDVVAINKPEQEPPPINPDTAILARHLLQLINDREKVERVVKDELPVNRDDASLGNTFVAKTITELPLDARNVANLLTLQPGATREGNVPGNRVDQANLYLDAVDINEMRPYLLILRNTSSSKTIRVPGSLSWIRFQLVLETAVTHENYRVTIKTGEGHDVTSVDWIEPLAPNQTTIDTPVISTVDLSSGDYVLLLMGRGLDGSLVKIAEYSIKVIKD